MPSFAAPTVLVFDVNETLLDIEVLTPFFQRMFGGRTSMRQWFAELILYSQAVTLSGSYVGFGPLAMGVLEMLATIHGVRVNDGDREELKSLMGSLPAHPEAAEALQKLRDAGFRLVTLTNSAPGANPSPLERAGLAGFFERTFSVEEVRRFKPAHETYQMVANALGLPLSALCLVAAHTWDTLGAASAGCSAALVARPGNAVLIAPGLPQPVMVAPDLARIAEAMIARWR